MKHDRTLRRGLGVMLSLVMCLGLLPVTALAKSKEIAIDELNFPDDTFRQYVLDEFDNDNSGYLDKDEIEAATEIDVYGESVNDLTGVEHFTALEYLDCGGNFLTTLDVSKNKALTYLDCGGNDLTTLDISENKDLEELSFRGNDLETLDVSNNKKLKKLDCYDSNMTSLDVSMLAYLEHLSCFNNNLTTLDVSKNEALTYLDCKNNRLTSLDVSENHNLETLYCSDNHLTSLNLGNNSALTTLKPNGNTYVIGLTGGKFDLAALEVFGFDVDNVTEWSGGDADEYGILTVTSGATEVTYKYDCGNENDIITFTLLPGIAINETNFPDDTFRDYVSENFDTDGDDVLSSDEIDDVTEIDVNSESIDDLTGIEYFTELEELYCYNNNLTELDLSNLTELTSIECYGNYIEKLDFSNNTKVEYINCTNNCLTSLIIGNKPSLWYLKCDVNRLTSLDLSGTDDTLTNFMAFTNYYDIVLDADGTFDLTKLEQFGFDLGKVKTGTWENGSVNGKTLTVTPGETYVTYEYDCGNNITVKFTLWVHDLSTAIEINSDNFPNEAFRNYILNNKKIDRNQDGWLSKVEVSKVLTIDVSNTSGLSDLTGIEYFTSLKDLYCSSCELTSLESVERANLPNLERLDCSNNQITSLNFGENTNLPNLQWLYCSNNRITSIDISKLTALKALNCENNQITSLNIQNNSYLSYLKTDGNDYRITLTDRTFDLTDLEQFGFNADKASEWTNGSVSGKVLTVNYDVDNVTYKYDCENNKNVTFKLSFETVTAKKYTVTAYGLYGSAAGIEPGDKFTNKYAVGEEVSLKIGKRDGYTLKDLTLVGIEEENLRWTAKGVEDANRTIFFTMPDNNVTVTVNWTKNGSGGSGGGGRSVAPTYSVTAPENIENGTVTISPKNAAAGTDVTVTVTPDQGYVLENLVITDDDGKEIKLIDNGNGEYTFTMPVGKVTVETSFKAEYVEPVKPVNPFTDVPSGSYYEDAVIWAVSNGITSGTTETTFSPDTSCTRAQILTFMWRAAGSPKATGSNPFTDVSADAYYYDAVLWAVENGITSGTSATTFEPDATVTRGQTVTFLYRMAGSPAANGSNFSDVSSDAYYADAVAWAVQQNITSGTGNNQFSPDADCTRAQIVTFLYRSMK